MSSRQVPSGWRPTTLGQVAAIRRDGVDPSTNGDVPYIALEDIAQASPRLLGWSSSTTATSNKTRFKRGDVLFGKLRPHLRKSARAPFDGVCSTDILAIVAADGLHAAYLAALCQSAGFQDFAVATSIGTKMPRTTWPQLATFPLLLPPMPEQRKIAEILSSVDEAIERTEAVMARVQDVKRALAQELLTRGMPGLHTGFKQTEVGEIPECWEVVRLGDVARVQSGIAKNEKAKRDNPVTLPYLRVANVQDGYIDLAEVKSIAVDAGDVPRCSLQPGDVLFTEGGDFDKLGRGAVWTAPISPCLHQNHVFAVRPETGRLLPQYLAMYAASHAGKRYFLRASKQTTNLASVNATQLRLLPAALPSIEEQESIICVVNRSDERSASESSRLQELKSVKVTLAAALLSGEVRVG